MHIEDLPDILTAKQISMYLSISLRRVYELMQISPKIGGIPCFETGKSKRVTRIDFVKWIDGRKSAKQESEG